MSDEAPVPDSLADAIDEVLVPDHDLRKQRGESASLEKNTSARMLNGRRKRAAESLANDFLDIDNDIENGKAPSADDIGDVTLRQTIQMLADPETSESVRLKCLELLTSLRAKKLVPKKDVAEREGGAKSDLLGGAMPSD